MNREMAWGAGGAAALAGLVGVLAVRTGVDLLPVVVALAAVAVVITCAGLALRHFAALVLLLLLIRPELDAVGHSTSSAVGLIFLGASAWWLFSQYRQDRLVTPSSATWALIVFVAAAVLSTLASHLPLVSAAATARLATGVLMFVVVEQLVRSGLLPTKAVHAAVAGSALLVCAHVGFQVVTGTAPVDDSTGLARVSGPFVHASVLGKYAAIVAVLMAARAVWTRTGDRWLWGLGSLAVGGVVLLTYTRAAWIALALGVVVLSYRRDHRWLPGIVGVGVVGILSIPSLSDRITNVWDPAPAPTGAPTNSLVWRVGYWQDLLPLGRINPLSGIGLDVVPSLRSEGLLPHNVWVQTWVELGLVGVLALVCVLLMTTLTLRRAGRALPERSGEQRASLEASIAVAVGICAVTVSENLLDETTTLWYAAAVMAAGWAASPSASTPEGDVRPWWINRSGWRVRRSRSASTPPSRR